MKTLTKYFQGCDSFRKPSGTILKTKYSYVASTDPPTDYIFETHRHPITYFDPLEIERDMARYDSAHRVKFHLFAGAPI